METLPREVTSVSKYEIEPFKQGRRVGCYFLGRTLGEGSFAKVKEGLHIITGEKVAVKIIDKKRAREDRYISKNLRREARIHQLVRHPNIIQLYEVLETDHYYYLIMEHSDGGELLDYICSRKRLDEHVARRLVSQLVSAVDGMHKSGVVHRDLKIENFLLSNSEDLKIIDFGLSNTLPQESMEEYERTGIFPQMLNTHCGSPAYAAPELLAQKKYGPQVDIWSIGINMYAMLTGFLPYMMEPFNVMDMYEKMMQRKMTPVPSFLSQACRDLLMRLLEPVSEWRITLKQVMKHKWFTGTEHIPRSIPLGDMMYQKRELCEPVLAYMKVTLRIRTRDTINAVVSNRAIHASAVYHLLVARLDRYLKNIKERNKDKQFAKVEIIKKSNLSTENINCGNHNNNSNSRINNNNSNNHHHHHKRFTFRGQKIDSKTRSHPNLSETECLDDQDNNNIMNLMGEQVNKQQQNDKRGANLRKKDSFDTNKTSSNTTANSSNHLSVETASVAANARGGRGGGNRRSNSSVDVNEYRKSQEIQDSIRNSLICGSKEDLERITANIQKQDQIPESPKEPFSKSVKGIISRKQSFDVGADFFDSSTNNNEKSIDVTRFIEPVSPSSPRTPSRRRHSNDSTPTSTSPTRRRHSNERIAMNNKHRKMSVDILETSEANVNEQKEPVPGWLITKVVKQPPLKEEHTNIVVPDKQIAITPQSQSKPKRTIHRPGTPERQRAIPQNNNKSSDFNNNSSSTTTKTPAPEEEKKRQRPTSSSSSSSSPSSSSVSQRIRQFTTTQTTTTPPTTTPNTKDTNNKKNPATRTDTSEIEEILRNVRTINKTHLSSKVRRSSFANNNRKPESETESTKTDYRWKPPTKNPTQYETTTNDNNKLYDTDDTSQSSSVSNTPSPPPQSAPSPTTINNYVVSDDDNTLNTDCDANNNNLEEHDESVNLEQITTTATSSNITPIKTIKISKKTLELNVKQFTQYNRETTIRPGDRSQQQNTAHHHTTLKPLQLKFNFTVRKKKPYKEKQQTRSLTDIVTSSSGSNKVNARPIEEQMLSPKHRCTEHCDIVSGLCSEKSDLSRDVIEERPTGQSRRPNSKTTVTIKSNNSSNQGNANKSHSNRTKLFLSTKKSSSRDYSDEKIENKLNTPASKDLSFDSGYFGTASSNYHDNNSNDVIRKQPTEVHPVKYRCIPIYQPEIVQTGMFHNRVKKGSAKKVSMQEEGDRKGDTEEGDEEMLHKKWGSQTIEPTQEPVDFVPRSAEFINNIKEKFRLERERKIEQLKKAETRRRPAPAKEYRHVRSRSDTHAENASGKEFKRSLSCKKYAIEHTTVGSQSPKYHRRASYNVHNTASRSPSLSTGDSVKNQVTTTSTVYDSRTEQGKVAAFAKSLENARWHKKPLTVSNW